MANNMNLSKDRPELEMIECSRQPGKLRLSRYACGRRYLRAQEDMEDIPENDFGIALKWGLELCRTCPLGLHCSKKIKIKSAPSVIPRGFRFSRRKKKQRSS